MAKKIFYFSLSLFILALIFLGAYNFAFKNNINSPFAEKPALESGQKEIIAVAGEEKIANVINEELIGAVASADGFLYYYSLDDQALKRSTLEGKSKTILISNLPGTATRVLFTKDQDQALLLLKQPGGGTLWHLANLQTKSLTPLKAEMGRLAWDNLGGKISYQYTDPVTGSRSLNIANPDGSEWKKLADLGVDDSFLASVPQSSLVSFWNRPTASSLAPLETVSIAGEKRTFFSGVFGGDYSWSPDGDRLLISGSDSPNGEGFSLRVMQNGGEARSLSLPTIITKTVWSKNDRVVYYALPGGLPENTLLPDDYFSKPLSTKDTFWKVDVTTGKKSRLIELKAGTRSFDSSDLFLSEEEEFLFFIDRTDKRLYRIEL